METRFEKKENAQVSKPLLSTMAHRDRTRSYRKFPDSLEINISSAFRSSRNEFFPVNTAHEIVIEAGDIERNYWRDLFRYWSSFTSSPGAMCLCAKSKSSSPEYSLPSTGLGVLPFDVRSIFPNTSFNENEPVVCRPEEALDYFLRTKMDMVVSPNFFVARK